MQRQTIIEPPSIIPSDDKYLKNWKARTWIWWSCWEDSVSIYVRQWWWWGRWRRAAKWKVEGENKKDIVVDNNQQQAESGPCKRVLCSKFHPNGVHLTTSGDDGTLRVWDLSKRSCWATVPAHSTLIPHCCHLWIFWSCGIDACACTTSWDVFVSW